MPSKKNEPAPEEADGDASGAGRSMWSGTISFGLVSIPVTLRPAVREGRVSMRMLDQDGTPLARQYYCPKENRQVHPEHLIRGYEIEKDEYVVVTEEELESLEPARSRDIDLRLFVSADQVDPIYFNRAYFLVPDREVNKAYRLLAETMQRTKKIGIATFIMHDREYLVAIIAEKGILRAETMRFHDEVRTPADVDLPEFDKPPARERSRFEKVIESLTESKLDPSELKSRYTQDLLKLIEHKQAKHEDLVEAELPEEAGAERSVSDLMAELRKSLEQHRAGGGSKKGGAASRESPADESEGESHHSRAAKTHPRPARAPRKSGGRKTKKG